jgi:hypothetical protein
VPNIALIHVKADTTNASERRGGFSDELLISEIAEFLDIKTPGAWAAAGDSKKITTAHTFDATKGFFELRARRGTAQGDGESIGEEGGGIMEYKPTVEVVGDNAKMCEYIENILQKELIIMLGSPVCDSTDPYVQYGSKCSAAVVDKVTFRSAKKSEGGLKVYTITFKTTEKFFYSSTITKNTA